LLDEVHWLASGVEQRINLPAQLQIAPALLVEKSSPGFLRQGETLVKERFDLLPALDWVKHRPR